MPICLNEQRRSPRIVYKRQESIKSIRLFADSVMNIHLMDVIVALLFDRQFGNCQIPKHQAQSVKYAFPIYRFPPSIPPESGTSAREHLQIKDFFSYSPNIQETFFEKLHSITKRKRKQISSFTLSSVCMGFRVQGGRDRSQELEVAIVNRMPTPRMAGNLDFSLKSFTLHFASAEMIQR